MSTRWQTVALVTLLLSFMLGIQPGGTQPARRRPQPTPTPSPAATEKPAVSINGGLLIPGDVLQSLLGIAGPPDFVQAVRGKEPVNDFVKFAYQTQGISVHIKTDKGQNNIIDAIVVTGASVRLVHVPFKIGEDYKVAVQAWGQPDRQEPGFMAYWKRGIYVGVSEEGHIIHITLAVPGKFDDEEQPPPSQKGLLRPHRGEAHVPGAWAR